MRPYHYNRYHDHDYYRPRYYRFDPYWDHWSYYYWPRYRDLRDYAYFGD